MYRGGRARRNRQQEGYVLLAILFALTVLIIGLAVAAPRAVTAVRHTQEDELIRRGRQYQVAIRRFYKKFGRYPSSIDQLDNTNNIRFLRRHYLDPLTGKDDWVPIQFGQARPPLGFFGQQVTNIGGQNPSGAGLGTSSIGSPLGGSSNSNSGTFGSNPGSSSSSSSSSASGTSGASGTAAGTSGTSSTSSSPTGSAGNPISSDQLSGRTFGGGTIVGVSIPSEKESLKEFEQKNHYNEWQFVYDPTMDPTLRAGVGGVGGVGGTIPGATGIGNNPNSLNPMSPGGSTNPNSGTGTGMGTGTGGTNPNPNAPSSPH